MMARLCHICSGAAVHTCRFCGRPVCPDHVDRASGACDECARGRTA